MIDLRNWFKVGVWYDKTLDSNTGYSRRECIFVSEFSVVFHSPTRRTVVLDIRDHNLSVFQTCYESRSK